MDESLSYTADDQSQNYFEEIRDAFRVFDRDGDGCITTDELSIVMASLGQRPTERELKDMIKEFDEDGNGTIELDEFIRLMSRKAFIDDAEERELRRVFKDFDKDNDGYISPEDLEQTMSQQGTKVAGDDISKMIEIADVDEDGRINFGGKDHN